MKFSFIQVAAMLVAFFTNALMTTTAFSPSLSVTTFGKLPNNHSNAHVTPKSAPSLTSSLFRHKRRSSSSSSSSQFTTNLKSSTTTRILAASLFSHLRLGNYYDCLKKKKRQIQRFLIVLVSSMVVLCYGTSLEANAAAAGIPLLGKRGAATTEIQNVNTPKRLFRLGGGGRRHSDNGKSLPSKKSKKQQPQKQQKSSDPVNTKNQKASSSLGSMVGGTVLATTAGILVAKSVMSKDNNDQKSLLNDDDDSDSDSIDATTDENVPSLAEALDALERAKARESVERVLDRVEQERKKAEARKAAAGKVTSATMDQNDLQSIETIIDQTQLMDKDEDEEVEDEESEQGGNEDTIQVDNNVSKMEVRHASVVEEDDLDERGIAPTSKAANGDNRGVRSLKPQPPKGSISSGTTENTRPSKSNKDAPKKSISSKTPVKKQVVDKESRAASAKNAEKIARSLLTSRLAIEAKIRNQRVKMAGLSSTEVKRASVVDEADLDFAIENIGNQMETEKGSNNDGFLNDSLSAQRKAEATARALLETRLVIEANQRTPSRKNVLNGEFPIASGKKAEATARALLKARLSQQSKDRESRESAVDPGKMSQKVSSMKAEFTARALLRTRLAMESKQKEVVMSISANKSPTSQSSQSADTLPKTILEKNASPDLISEVEALKVLGLASEATERKMLDKNMELKRIAEGKQRALLAARLKMKKTDNAESATSDHDRQSQEEESEEIIAARYASMDLETRAFNILLDLGMIERTPDPDDVDDIIA